jgi:hypothetical protein
MDINVMDQRVIDAVSATPLSAATASGWYYALCAAYDTNSAEWDGFAGELRQQAASAGFGSEVADEFVEHLGTRSGDPLETVREMYQYGPDQLAALHQQDTDDSYDPEAWLRFLSEYGAAWHGDEASWSAFTEWFHYEAGQVGLGTPAYEFVTYVESQPDKIVAFAQYGIIIGVAEEPASSYPELREGDSGDWVDYLDQMLASQGF